VKIRVIRVVSVPVVVKLVVVNVDHFISFKAAAETLLFSRL
jgi:hypothetical protein